LLWQCGVILEFVERLNRLETNEKLMAQDLLKKAEQTPKNQEMYMLIEYQAKSLENMQNN
jgi:hypothetical protein